MWNCAYQIYPRTIKVVSILSKFIFLDLKTCFFEKRVSKEISYIVYISAILPNIVYISLVSLKKISLRPDHNHDEINDDDDGIASNDFDHHDHGVDDHNQA